MDRTETNENTCDVIKIQIKISWSFHLCVKLYVFCYCLLQHTNRYTPRLRSTCLIATFKRNSSLGLDKHTDTRHMHIITVFFIFLVSLFFFLYNQKAFTQELESGFWSTYRQVQGAFYQGQDVGEFKRPNSVKLSENWGHLFWGF